MGQEWPGDNPGGVASGPGSSADHGQQLAAAGAGRPALPAVPASTVPAVPAPGNAPARGWLGSVILAVTGGKPVSKKVISQSFGHFLGLVAAYVIARGHYHVDAQTSFVIAAGSSVVTGWFSGWVAREEGIKW